MDTLDSFNSDEYKSMIVDKYKKIKPTYEQYTSTLYDLITTIIDNSNIYYYTIEKRTKSIESFGEKALRPSETNPNAPKYLDPLDQITDISGIRIITYYLNSIKEVEQVIRREFEVIEIIDKNIDLINENKFGYQSIHYIIKFNDNRKNLAEYNNYKSLKAEIQIRTILQHAWAEIEHDIQYKSIYTIPSNIKRRFTSLAGLLEIADREFQTIHDEDEKYNNIDLKNIRIANYEDVRLTPKSLKIYLDNKIDSDARMTDFSYDFETRILLKMGFSNIKQIDDCINSYDDDRLSRLIWGTRQGQLTRFECMLLAGMGENFLEKHIWNNQEWFREQKIRHLGIIKDNGITIKNYLPSNS